MVDMNRYVVGGTVKRDRIVTDITRGRIQKSDIIELDRNPIISGAYFGENAFVKQDKSTWSEKYLDELSLVVVSEAFGKEYLLYLNEVAQFVIDKEKKKEKINKLIKGGVIGGIVVVLIVIAIMFMTSKEKKDTIALSVSSVEVAQNTYLCLVKVLG